MPNPLLLLAFGVFVGVFSGLMGLGGGAIMIPIMVLLLGFEQAKAHGMSLMVMIPPVTLPAVIGYWRNGYIQRQDLWIAALIALGILGGSYFGAQLADAMQRHKDALKLVFGFVLVYVAAYSVFSWFGRENLLRTVVLSSFIVLVAIGTFAAVRWYDLTRA